MDTLKERFDKIRDSLSPEATKLIVDLFHELELKDSVVNKLTLSLEAEKKSSTLLNERSKFFMDAYFRAADNNK